MSQYYTILTNIGAAALANATALGQPISITQFAVGDGGGADYDPDITDLKTSEALVNEVYRGAVNQLSVNPDNPASYYIEGVVPVEIGGWTAREVGWFLSDGRLFAITKLPPSYKTVPADGAATELPIRTYLAIGSDANVTLKIDPTVVLATRKYVDDSHRYISVTANTVASTGKLHIFHAHADLSVSLTPGQWIDIAIDKAVDVSIGDCRLVAQAEIQSSGGNSKIINIKDGKRHMLMNKAGVLILW